jgi:hypothetical protein
MEGNVKKILTDADLVKTHSICVKFAAAKP